MIKDDRGLSGPEMFFLFFIILLLLSTVAMAVLIDRMGPEDEPNFDIQEVYHRENEDGFTSYVYLTNLGEPEGNAVIEWTVIRDGDRMVDSGDLEVNVPGRTTERISFDIKFDQGYVNNIEIEVKHGGEVVSTYSGSITPQNTD